MPYIVAMSGGVDSSVSLLLAKRMLGEGALGFTLQLTGDESDEDNSRDAAAICESLGCPPILFTATSENNAPAKEMVQKSRKSKAFIFACAVSLLLCLFFEIMIWGRLQNNAADEALCRRIGDEIAEYEKESGNEILYVSISHDAKITKTNPWVVSIGDANVRAFSKEWSDVAHINVLLNKSYQKAPVSDEVYQAHFAGKNWSEFSAEEQLVFDGNTLHICVY